MNGPKILALVSIALIVVFALGIEARAKEKKIQKKDVPAAVTSAFEKAYPSANVKGYSIEKEKGKTFFEVESYQGTMTLDVAYLPDGTVVEIEEGVTGDSLPDAVKAAVKSTYPKGTIAKAEKKTVDTLVTYEMKVTLGKINVRMEINPSGKILKQSKGGAKKEKDEDEEND